MLHLPYFLDISEYAIQGASFGTSSRLPIIGHDGGPGGKGNPLRLLWSRNTMRRKRKRARIRQSRTLMIRNMTRLAVCGGGMGVECYKARAHVPSLCVLICVLISRGVRDSSHRGKMTEHRRGLTCSIAEKAHS